MLLKSINILVLVGVVGIAVFLGNIKRVTIASHLAGHPAYIVEDLIPKDIAADLTTLMRGANEFPSNLDLSSSYKSAPVFEQIGEGLPINEDGSCSHDFLIPNFDKTQCILPQRVDVGKHYVTTGGVDGTKEKYEELVNRVSSFGSYTFVNDVDDLPVSVKTLFQSDHFQVAAKSVCPSDATHLDPFQYNFIINVPGQTVAFHLDAPVFWGASRNQYPQWLLVSMVFSGLFQKQFIHQIQVVGYLHEWHNDSVGGEFVYYTNDTSPLQSVQPLPRSGTLVDGTKVLHASRVYRPDVKAPVMSKDKRCTLKYLGDEKWHIACGSDVVQTYDTNDLRVSIVYRARCFKDAEEQARFKRQTDVDTIPLNTILDTFTRDLASKGVLSAEKVSQLSKLDLAMLIIDTYVKYPLPPLELALVPFNYCAIPRLIKWTKPLFDLIC